jgi:hypothetical protein
VVSAAVGGGGARDEEDLPSSEAEGEEQEKIEVHVHVHRGKAGAAKKKKKRRPARPALTGVLFDWQGHYDRVCKGPAPPTDAGSAGATATTPTGSTRTLPCNACGAKVPRFARKCGVCEAAQPRGIIARVTAALGIASVIGVFALCQHILGESVREHKPSEPLRADFSDDDAYIVEVPATSSPFTYDFTMMGIGPRTPKTADE